MNGQALCRPVQADKTNDIRRLLKDVNNGGLLRAARSTLTITRPQRHLSAAHQCQHERERAQWADWNLVCERQTRERIEERYDYWQLDRLGPKRDHAQEALDERSGWIKRYVLR